jgi:hypothetical protein
MAVILVAIVVVAVVVIVIVVFGVAEDACTNVSVPRLEVLRALACDDLTGEIAAPEAAIRVRVTGPSAPAFVVSVRAVTVKPS